MRGGCEWQISGVFGGFGLGGGISCVDGRDLLYESDLRICLIERPDLTLGALSASSYKLIINNSSEVSKA